MSYLIDLFDKKLTYDKVFLRNAVVVTGILILFFCFHVFRMAEVSYRIDDVRNMVMREWCLYHQIDGGKHDSLVDFNKSVIAREFDVRADKLKMKALNPFDMPVVGDFDWLKEIIFLIPAYN